MNHPILNRAGKHPDDGYYQIEALGEFVNHDAEVVQVIDDKAVTSIVNRFAQAAQAANFAGLRIDKDHLSQSMENPTESYGWAMALRNRDGVPEAKIAWTGIGKPLVEAKEDQPPAYKFFSTEYGVDKCERIGSRIVNGKSYAVVRPLELVGLSLTNDPNNKGQRPISNRNGDAGAGNQTEPTMKEINEALGLSADAPEASAVAEILKIKNRATVAEGERDTLKKENASLLETQVEADLETYKGVIVNRDTVKKALIANRAATIELLKSLKTAAPEKNDRITNRGSARAPESQAATEEPGESDAERARGAKIANRASELRKTNPRLTRSQAFAKAQAELAE